MMSIKQIGPSYVDMNDRINALCIHHLIETTGSSSKLR